MEIKKEGDQHSFFLSYITYTFKSEELSLLHWNHQMDTKTLLHVILLSL